MAFKAKFSRGDCLPSAGSLGCGAQSGIQTSQSFGRISEAVIVLLFVDHPPGGMGFDFITPQPLLLSHYDSFFIFLTVEDLFWYVWVFFIDGCL